MSETMQDGDGAASTVEQIQEKAGEVVGQAQEKAGATFARAADRAREQIDTRSTETGEQLGELAAGMRRTGHSLRGDGKDEAARLNDMLVERVEQLGGFLRDTDADTLLRQVEEFGRRRPWSAAGVGIAVGFAASRFLRASSRRRYAAGGSSRGAAPPYATAGAGVGAGAPVPTGAPAVRA